ncbi:MAG: FAD/FMN-dependent dehydrogenase [Verrucomicrobia bacterium]|nr:FAD/FMN-dependent dehydrogenase [Verrucomicrobiota bacterium]
MSSGFSRRTLVKGMAAAQVLAWLPRRMLAAVADGSSKIGDRILHWRRVRPRETGWPGAAEWQVLAAEVGSNLIRVEALLAGKGAKENLRNPFYLGDQPAGTQVSGWFGAWSPAPSVYAVQARQASQVAAAVNFAREHRLRLVVKGAGHSY